MMTFKTQAFTMFCIDGVTGDVNARRCAGGFSKNITNFVELALAPKP